MRPEAVVPGAAVVSMLDLVFPVRGEALPRDYREPLRAGLQACLAWLDEEPDFGIHGIRTAGTDADHTLLPRRARLTLRVPQARADAVAALGGRRLRCADAELDLGPAQVRPLVAAATLYSDFVCLDGCTDCEFEQGLQDWLDRLGLRARPVCGGPRSLRIGASEVCGHAVALCELRPQDSIRLQCCGIGPYRQVGCGIFVPHKTISGLE